MKIVHERLSDHIVFMVDYSLQPLSDQHTIMLEPADFQQQITLKRVEQKQGAGLVNSTVTSTTGSSGAF